MKPLPVLGVIPRFQLLAQTGSAFDSRTLDGHIWIANFIYTTCDGPCPMMSRQMRGIQNSTSSSPDVKLVSFTVDPARDTPEVLAKYAQTLKADPARWYFLTGEPARLTIWGSGVQAERGGWQPELQHALRADRRKRRIRGFYIASDDDFPGCTTSINCRPKNTISLPTVNATPNHRPYPGVGLPADSA